MQSTQHTEAYAPSIAGERFVVPETVNTTRRECHFGHRLFACLDRRPQRFDDLLRNAARDFGGNEALVCGDERLSYAEFDAAVSRVANGLTAAGISPGERVGIMLGNGIDFFFAIMGAVRMGAIAVPMSVKMSAPETGYILNHCQAAALITGRDILPRIPPAAECPSLRHIWVAGDGETTEAAPAGMTAFPELLAADDAPPPPVGSEDDTIFLFYTSGTTGKPKGARIANINIVHSALQYAYAIDLKPGQRGLLAIPGAHISGFMALYTNMLSVAGATVILPDYRTAEVLEVMKREAITFTVFVPSIYQLILMHADFDASAFGAWRTGIFGGGIMPPATVQRLGEVLPDLRLINAYGATETTSPVSIMPAFASRDRPASVGLLVQCAEAVVMDDAGKEVARGESGELWVRGPMVVPGYWADPEQTARAFIDGYWRTGDVVSMDAEGYLYIHDRKKDMINKGGYKVFSAEVENALVALEGVVECAAVPVADPVMGERVCVFVTCRPGETDEAALRRHATATLADYKQPDFYLVGAEPLPRNPNGKVLKAPLAEKARVFEGKRA
ncbi:class I adenylate-forming enzyme family protein [Stappia indica]|uniref:class I adenylate-forming enzyme family protein n=1 Tax=Stappia indica TaxID=538381 RepID=UPI001CD2FBCF|nr:AMP-binding protein [Stappia indica]MCA1300184.1 AMP-binding protein [Stappia indica]